jgi:hypothetical protein
MSRIDLTRLLFFTFLYKHKLLRFILPPGTKLVWVGKTKKRRNLKNDTNNMPEW